MPGTASERHGLAVLYPAIIGSEATQFAIYKLGRLAGTPDFFVSASQPQIGKAIFYFPHSLLSNSEAFSNDPRCC
jgi:hypothetical protein